MKAELLILGVLHRGNFHPYEIKRRLEQAMVECYTDVDVGTLYYAVRQLAKQDFITANSRERVARGGIRTIYAITAKGRRRFSDLLNEQFSAPGAVADTLYGALLFLDLGDRKTVAPQLRKRIARQTELIQEVVDVRKRFGDALSPGGKHLARHLELQRKLDRKWLLEVLESLENQPD